MKRIYEQGISQNQLIVVPIEPDDKESHSFAPISWCVDEIEHLGTSSPQTSSSLQVRDILDTLPRNLNKDKDMKTENTP